jgi:prepilin-type N-terminal cleavage/methylation domain-containing protein
MILLKLNQRGLTLIEVLATLVILSVAGVIIWNVFFQGYNYSQKAISKNSMQQEANLVITSLKKIHQTSDEYTIANFEESGCSAIKISYIEYIITHPTEVNNQLFHNARLCISSSFTGTINTKDINRVPLTITINDKNNPSDSVQIDTILFRMKEES